MLLLKGCGLPNLIQNLERSLSIIRRFRPWCLHLWPYICSPIHIPLQTPHRLQRFIWADLAAFSYLFGPVQYKLNCRLLQSGPVSGSHKDNAFLLRLYTGGSACTSLHHFRCVLEALLPNDLVFFLSFLNTRHGRLWYFGG